MYPAFTPNFETISYMFFGALQQNSSNSGCFTNDDAIEKKNINILVSNIFFLINRLIILTDLRQQDALCEYVSRYSDSALSGGWDPSETIISTFNTKVSKPIRKHIFEESADILDQMCKGKYLNQHKLQNIIDAKVKRQFTSLSNE